MRDICLNEGTHCVAQQNEFKYRQQLIRAVLLDLQMRYD